MYPLMSVLPGSVITCQANVKAVRSTTFLGRRRWSHCWWCCWSLTTQGREQNSGYKLVSPIKTLIFGLNQKDGMCIYIYIVHIKLTLHIHILVYCKNVPTQLIMDLPRI